MQWQCDHRIPLCEGGVNSRSNLQALCANCHCEKSALENIRRVKRRREAQAARDAEEVELRKVEGSIDLEVFRYDGNFTNDLR